LTNDREFRWALNPVRFAREALGFEPDAPQARVLAAQANRGILNCTRQWGKSTVTAIRAVHRAWAIADSLVVVVTPGERQSGEFVRKASRLVRKLGMRVRGDGDNDISLLFPNASRIVGLPGVDATTRGFSNVSLLLVDEASRVSDEMYEAVRPMLAVSGGDLWLMSTPSGRCGFFFEEWERGGPEWLRIAVPATECPRISHSFLAEERRKRSARSFGQEYLCEFGDSEDSVFREDIIRRAIRKDVKPLFGK
jgi:hypothetical protein